MDQEPITDKGWRRDVWRDHLTLEILKIEVTPEKDLNSHISSVDCDCIPQLLDSKDGLMLIHNSFDGREVLEQNERGN